ncbi:ABC transporter substrate-binding protein [Marinactinospora endophytica]
MQTFRRRPFQAAAAAAGVGALLLTTACGGGDSADANGEITLVVDTYGVFGYDELYKQFEAEHPNVTIEERNITDLAEYTPQLQQNIAAGSGAGDVVALEEGNAVQFLQQSDKFVDLREYGAEELEGNFLAWKWEQGKDTEGKLVGLGTDIGSMGMCFNIDLFEEAGLPTDREEVAELWPTWDDFIETGADFVSTITPYFSVLTVQGGEHTFQDTEGNLVVETNPTIRESWDLVTRMAEEGLSASLPMWSDEWNAAIQSNAFATLPCPAWMLGHIESTAGTSGANKWDVAAVPEGRGNWGGSWLAVPTQSEHPEMAAELAKFLTSPEGQLEAWNSANVLPSSPEAIDSPEVQEFEREYFNNAPVGQIYGASAKELEPVYFGPDNQAIGDAFRAAQESVEQGQATPDEAWNTAVEAAKRATGES